MPPKKSTGGQKAVAPDPTVLPDGGDPALVAMAIVDKKKRNLEKRKNKLESLKEGLDSGTRLDADQIAAVAKLKDVSVQLELIKELQKQFTTLQSDFQKSRKRQQKADRLSARESEREAERRAVAYTLRVQDLLTNMGDEDKDNFRTGSNGAMLLSESELSQLDEVYGILTPPRQGNPSYADNLERASEFIQQVMEQSSREVLGSTYKQLYELLQRIEGCGYFDRPASDNGDDERESQEEGVADDEDYRSAEDNLTPANEEIGSYERSTPVGDSVEPVYTPPTEMIPQEPEPVRQPDMLTAYMPSAPSPTFPGLGPSPIQPVAGDGFSFMHDSEVDRGSLQAISQPPTTLDSARITPSLLPTSTDPQRPAPPMNYPQYPPKVTEDMNKLSIVGPGGDIIPHPASTTVSQPGAQGDLAATDVATGQPNQSTDAYQGGGLMNSAPTSYQYGVGAMGDASSGYQNQFGAPVRMGGQPRGGRGNRRGGGSGPGGPKGSGGMYRNGRGMQGGYDDMTAYNRGYPTAGGAGYHPRGGSGRPNYRPAQGTRK